MFYFTIVISAVLFVVQAQEPQNICETATRVHDSYRRSVNYTVGMSGDENEEYICDQFISDGWYIFEGEQGQEMPTYPPKLERCGTFYPIWFNGTMPKDDNEIVKGKACSVDLTSNPCFKSYDIQVMKCGSQFAYYLPSTAGSCPEGYCIGKEIPCPKGESSENGFTPGCIAEGFPVLLEDPKISFEVGTYDVGEETMREVVMLCNVIHNETILVDVEWYLDDIKVATHISSNLPAKLHEIEWYGSDAKLGSDLRCQMRPRYDPESIPGPMRQATYFMGFMVGNLDLEVEEGHDAKPDYYTVTPTIPVLCPVGRENPEICFLSLQVIQLDIEGDNPAVCDGTSVHQSIIERSECMMKIPMTENPDENTTFSLAVYGAIDGIYDGDMTVKLYLNSPKDHPMHKIWGNYQLPMAYVTVKDKDTVIGDQYCFAHNDPHMITMDGRAYDNQLEGEFWLYRHKIYPSEVQVYFKQNGKYSMVCGAAVRSAGDLFIYDFCREGAEGRIRLYECQDYDLVVNKNGDTVKIEFPHGTKVEITKSNVKIIPSLHDINSTQGLCGNFDLVCGNDFVAPGGKMFPDSCNPKPDCSNIKSCSRTREHEFSTTWRVLPKDSLYQGKITESRPIPKTVFCACEENEDDEEVKATCTYSRSPDHCIDGSMGGLVGQCNATASFQNAGSDDVVDEVGPFEYDPNFEPPEPTWSDPWNEVTAREECEKFFSKLQSFDTCINIPGVDYENTISSCIEDIKITNETGFNIIHAGSFISMCLNQISRNMSLFSYDNATGEVQPPNDMTDNICPSNCYDRGTCEKGVCKCDDGFFGAECFYDENKVPTLYSLPGGGLCDLQSRPCQKTPVTGSYFLNKPSLTCHIQPVLLNTEGTKIPQEETTTKPTFDHMERIMCPLPVVTINYEEDDIFTVGYTIAVSNDEVTQSDKRQLATFDSVCMNCTVDLSCVHLDNTCLIQGNCYRNGQQSNTDPCLMCDPLLNDWTEVLSNDCQPKGGLIAGITILAVALASTVVIASVVIMKKKKQSKVGVDSHHLELSEAD